MTKLSGTILALTVLAVAPLALEAQKAPSTLDARAVMTPQVTSGFSGGNRASSVREITVGSRMSSSLDDSDDAIAAGNRVELWGVQLRAGQRVRVTVRSTAFDTQMIMFDPDNQDSAVGNDDYEEGSTDSRVFFTAPKAGVYGIIVSSYGPAERGAYTIEVAEVSGN